jgi:large subunit ribosomal protein L21
VGTTLGALYWYWQKSTSAEEGALAVLDRLATAEAKVRDLEAQVRLAESGPPVRDVTASAPADDLQSISGIGPTYAQRLNQAGIKTFAELAACTSEQLREIVGLRSFQLANPEEWIATAKELSSK